MKPGNLRQYRVIINNFDVTDATTGCRIFHDITSPTWSAQVFFMDSANLINSIPIVSGSTIKIMLETQHNVSTDMKKEFEFIIYRVGDKDMQNQMNLTYTVFAASKEFSKNLSTRVSRNFVNTKMTDCIKSIVSDNFGGMNVSMTACDNKSSLLIPNLTPFNAIGWMLKMAHVNNRADFLFFQSETNEFTLDSILNCFSKMASGDTLKVRPSNMGLELPTDVFNIFHYEFEHSDAAINMASGYYGNTLKTFDFYKKEWKVQTYKTSEVKNWEGADYDNAAESVVNFKAMSHLANGNNSSPSDDANIWLQSRMASLLNLEQEKLIVQIPGTVGIYKWLGKSVNVNLPNQDATAPSASMDSKRSGRYLATSIVHNFDRQTYTNTLELVKRSV